MIYIVTFQNPFEDTNGVACHIVDLRNGLLKMGKRSRSFARLTTFLEETCFIGSLSGLYLGLLTEDFPSSGWSFCCTSNRKSSDRSWKRSPMGVVNGEDIISLYALSKVRKAGLKKIFTIHFAIAPWEQFLGCWLFQGK